MEMESEGEDEDEDVRWGCQWQCQCQREDGWNQKMLMHLFFSLPLHIACFHPRSPLKPLHRKAHPVLRQWCFALSPPPSNSVVWHSKLRDSGKVSRTRLPSLTQLLDVFCVPSQTTPQRVAVRFSPSPPFLKVTSGCSSLSSRRRCLYTPSEASISHSLLRYTLDTPSDPQTDHLSIYPVRPPSVHSLVLFHNGLSMKLTQCQCSISGVRKSSIEYSMEPGSERIEFYVKFWTRLSILGGKLRKIVIRKCTFWEIIWDAPELVM